jgi:hypothetical protein
MDGDTVPYNEIDSSKMIDEEVEALILEKPNHLFKGQAGVELDHDDVAIVGVHVERYTGYDVSPYIATGEWMEWDATSHR